MKLKEINGKPYQECEVVMLPTEKASKLVLAYNNKLSINWTHDLAKFDDATYQHLYILSNEEIKEGDWCICDLVAQPIVKITNLEYAKQYNCKKIIATTDSSLTIENEDEMEGRMICKLPQPSQSFIEKYIKSYNEGNIISKVLVEYDKLTSMNQRNIIGSAFNLKIDKSNQITIIKQKDSWNREEVINIIQSYKSDLLVQIDICKGKNESLKKVFTDNWIEQNL